MQEFFGENMVTAQELEQTTTEAKKKGTYQSNDYSIKPMDPTENIDLKNLVRITHFGAYDDAGLIKPNPNSKGDFKNFKDFDFEGVDYKQIQVEDDSVHKKRDSRWWFDSSGAYNFDEDGKKRNISDQSHVGAKNPAEFIDKWYRTKHKRKLRAKRARIKKQAGG